MKEDLSNNIILTDETLMKVSQKRGRGANIQTKTEIDQILGLSMTKCEHDIIDVTIVVI